MRPENKTDVDLKRHQSRFENLSLWSGIAVVAGLALETWLAVKYRPVGETRAQTYGPIIADAFVFGGVFFEIMFGRWALHQGSELQQRAERALAEATERAGKAVERAGEASERAAEANERAGASEERAKVLQREAEQARLAHERLRAELAWRTISQQSGNTLASILGAYNGATTIEYVAGDPEALSLAFTLADIFSTAGWNVGMASCSIPNALIFGVFIPEDNGPQRDIVRTAFITSGLGFSRDNIVAGAMIQMGNPIEGSVKIFGMVRFWTL